MRINPKRRPRNPRPALSMPDWISVGAPVVELEYLGAGRYWANHTAVARLTPRQVITATGRRFWLDSLRLVGQQERQLAGVNVHPIRLVKPGNPRIPRT